MQANRRIRGCAALMLLSTAGSGSSAEPEKPLPTAFDAGWLGTKTCEKLFENERMRVGRCSFPPGIGHERHFHPPHWGYVVQSATMRITDADGTRERVLQAGTNWWSDGIKWHEAINVGTTTAVYVIVEPKIAP